MLYRGFKTHATRLADKFRVDLELGPLDPFPAFDAADRLGISVCDLSDFTKILTDEQIGVLRDSGCFSAATVLGADGSSRRIIFNDSHSPERIVSDLAHELSHAILKHPAATAVDPFTGCRNHNKDHEEQAAYLSATLLVTERAAVAAVAKGADLTAMARRFGVSVEMLRWRINMTGARRRVPGGARA